jgi:uncharacterized membrane protein
MKHQKAKTSSPLLNLERLQFLIDGVFAITLTLLVLDLKLPSGSDEQLGQALIGLLPRLAAYLFAFVTIANQWIFHHRIFRFVQHANSNLVLQSFLYLLFLTLIPATTAILGDAPTNPLAAACFSTNIMFLCLAAWSTWHALANESQLLTQDADREILHRTARV